MYIDLVVGAVVMVYGSAFHSNVIEVVGSATVLGNPGQSNFVCFPYWRIEVDFVLGVVAPQTERDAELVMEIAFDRMCAPRPLKWWR